MELTPVFSRFCLQPLIFQRFCFSSPANILIPKDHAKRGIPFQAPLCSSEGIVQDFDKCNCLRPER